MLAFFKVYQRGRMVSPTVDFTFYSTANLPSVNRETAAIYVYRWSQPTGAEKTVEEPVSPRYPSEAEGPLPGNADVDTGH